MTDARPTYLHVVFLLQLPRHVFAHLHDVVFPTDARAARHAWLEGQDDPEGVVDLGNRAGDVGVVVHPKDLWLGVEGQVFDVVQVGLVRRVRVGRDGVVDAGGGEGVRLGDDLGVEKVGDEDVAGAHVL